MAIPKAKTGWAERVEVAVETAVGSGRFEADDRLRAEMVESLRIGKVAEARIAVRTELLFTAADAQRRYGPDRRMIVRTKEAILFDGYPLAGRLTMDARRGEPAASRRRSMAGGGTEFQLILEHAVGRLGRDGAAQIIGRYGRDALIVDGLQSDPAAWAGASVLLTGLSCVFNPDRTPNCDPVPIEVADGTGGVRKIHVFSDDTRTDAIPWTYAGVLRYLLHFYGCHHSPLDAFKVLQQTDAIAMQAPEGREVFLATDDLTYALLGRPDTLVTEAADLLEAVSLLSAASGVHFSIASRRAGQGVRTSWRIWTTRSGTTRDLRLATAARDANGQPLYDTAATPAVDLFEANNVTAARMDWDSRAITSVAMVIGGVKHFEVQAELLPGWLPRGGLDNVDPAQRAAAKAAALSEAQIQTLGVAAGDDPWFRKYHRRGAEFASNKDIGRLWVLNEAGTYPSAQYARNAPFDVYDPFDFSTVWPGPWMRRRRRLLPLAPLPNDTERVIVEVSFDGGASWDEIIAGYTVASDECGIWFDLPNLLSITPYGSEETNLWNALVDQTCRVRVRAMVASDERLIVGAPVPSSPSLMQNARLFYAPQRFGFVRRLPPEPGAASNPAALGSNDRDDTSEMRSLAEAAVWAQGAMGVAGRAVIPWLDTKYEVGDRIVGIRGRGLAFAAERTPSRRYACVIGKRYHLGPGRFETELLLGRADGFSRRGAMED